MTRYYTQMKRRRLYSWDGRPVIKDRKVLHLHYGGLVMRWNGGEATISPGDFVLIESEDEERPFVGKLKGLYDDGAGKDSSKHAIVEWFLRYEEVPLRKRKLLGRDPHPQEIFVYNVPTCENDIDAETIIGTVQISQLKLKDRFPEVQKSGTVLFVKLSWDGKSFKPLPSRGESPISSESNNSLPKLLFCPAEEDPDGSRKMTRSATRAQRQDSEIESRHSASKSSHSIERSVRRATSGTGTPGARKKLQLNSPPKSQNTLQIEEDTCLDDFQTLEPAPTKRKVAFSGLLDSPPKKALNEHDMSLNSCFIPLKPLQDIDSTKIRLRLTPLRHTPPLEQRTDNSRVEEYQRKLSHNEEKLTSHKSKTPQKLDPTPKKGTDSSRRVTEEDNVEDIQTPRSHRRSARASASLIRRQIKESAVFSSSDDVDDEEESEEQVSPKRVAKRGVLPRTPRSSRKSPARTPNKTPLFKTRVATPKIPERNQPVQNPASVLEEARIRLHVSAVPESLPCREQEYQDVYSFVESKLLDGTGGCMYISGVPGTGKTATVHEAMRSLQRVAEEEEMPSFQYIEINGMKLTDPHQAYVQILKLLTGQKATADHAAALLEKRFSTPASKRETTVLLVDELDLLWTRKQNVMYSLFDWPTRKQAKLIVLAIANTMDLPERIMMNRVASRLGLTRMSFQPYTHKQLQQIITSRLNHVKAFDDDAIQLVSRKVAALSGDARRCLDICRRATEICEFSGKKNESPIVKMPHVIEALDEMFSSPYVMAIRSSSVLEQAFLRAVIAEFRRSGLEEATFQQVYHQYMALCRLEGVQPPNMSETMAVCLRLGACRLLLVESSRNDLQLRVRINVSQDDIMYALKED
ncbi:origin recognition complex subunit 1 isoform X2 [Pseudophryne corroboree]|uniref:origin recognition complex subunit 1 isoform X2 n=1 Tax=Pseudophryne corroboree TaxID=495146 RepID=UPI003081761C